MAQEDVPPPPVEAPAKPEPEKKLTQAEREEQRKRDDELRYRVSLGRADDVRLLLKQGASVDLKTGEGTPILSLAASRLDPEGLNVIKVMVENNVQMNARDAKGQTALFYAARAGNLEAVKYLLAEHLDPYAIDNRGNIARTSAFMAGHKNVAQAIDDFVTRQTEAVREQAESYKLYLQMQKERAAADAQKKAYDQMKEEEQKEKEKPKQPDAPTVHTGGQPLEEQALSREREKEVGNVATELSYNICAYQYWSFCRDAGQSTELEAEELSVAIQAHHDRADDLKEQLYKKHRVADRLINTISDSAQQRIYNQLAVMVSSKDRYERGVGRMEDMIKRCGQVSREWRLEPPGIISRGAPRKGGQSQAPAAPQGGGKMSNFNDPSAAYDVMPGNDMSAVANPTSQKPYMPGGSSRPSSAFDAPTLGLPPMDDKTIRR